MAQHKIIPVVLGSLLVMACGTRRLVAADETGESSGTEEQEEDEPGDPAPDPAPDPDSDPDPFPNTFVPEDDTCGTGGGCDSFAQDCPTGEKCVAYASTGERRDANKCAPVLGELPAGEACSYANPVEATDNCDEDSACWDLHEADGEWAGVCRSHCTGSADDPACPAPGDGCLITGEGSVSLCVSRCDPLLQPCAEGSACVWSGDDFLCTATADPKPLAEPCGFINDCDPGLFCLDAELLEGCAGHACCTPYCAVELGDEGCAALPGASCVPFFEPEQAPPGLDLLGVCVLESP